MKVFDVHQHLGSLRELYLPGEPVETQRDAESRIEVMSQHGIASAAALPPPLYDRTEGWRSTRQLNAAMAAYRDRHRDHFPVAFGVVEPLHSVASSLDEITHLTDELGLTGIVWHHKFHGVGIDAPVMDTLVRAGHEKGLRFLVHMYAESTLESPWAMMKLASRHPEVPFVALDAFTSVSQAKYLPILAERCPNVSFETAGTFPLGRLVERFVAEVGAHRVVFGSQLYARPQWWLDPHVLSELRLAADLDAHDLERVLWRNAAELLDLPDAPEPDVPEPVTAPVREG